MNNRYGKGRFNGPIFKLQPKSFDFDTEKADLEEDYLKNKMKEIGVPGNDHSLNRKISILCIKKQ